MARLLHIVDPHHATASALGALERVQSGAITNAQTDQVLILPSDSGDDRATIVGVRNDLSRPPSRRELNAYEGIAAWDEQSAQWCDKRKLNATRLSSPIPIDRSRLTNVDRSAIRTAMGVENGAITVAWLHPHPNESAITGLCVLVTALALAGYPMAGVILNGSAPREAVAKTMRRLDARVSVLSPRRAPWQTLAGCDFALAPTVPLFEQPIQNDLVNWANAHRVDVIAPPSLDQDQPPPGQRLERFSLARSLVCALDKRSQRAFQPPRSTDVDNSTYDHWISETLESCSAALHSS